MQVFISWSGSASKELALTLDRWLRTVLQGSEPWVSESMDKGVRWSLEISQRLEDCDTGILCITPDNHSAPWLLFEAGAIAKSVHDSRLCPYLLGLKKSELPQGPLAQFQLAEANKEGTWELLQTLNGRLDKPVATENLQALFEVTWPKLSEELAAIPLATASTPERDEGDMLAEVLTISRNLARDFATLTDAERSRPRVVSDEDDRKPRMKHALGILVEHRLAEDRNWIRVQTNDGADLLMTVPDGDESFDIEVGTPVRVRYVSRGMSRPLAAIDIRSFAWVRPDEPHRASPEVVDN